MPNDAQWFWHWAICRRRELRQSSCISTHNLVLCALEILAVLGIQTLELHIRLGFCRCILLLVNREPCRDGRFPRLTRCPSAQPSTRHRRATRTPMRRRMLHLAACIIHDTPLTGSVNLGVVNSLQWQAAFHLCECVMLLTS